MTSLFNVADFGQRFVAVDSTFERLKIVLGQIRKIGLQNKCFQTIVEMQSRDKHFFGISHHVYLSDKKKPPRQY